MTRQRSTTTNLMSGNGTSWKLEAKDRPGTERLKKILKDSLQWCKILSSTETHGNLLPKSIMLTNHPSFHWPLTKTSWYHLHQNRSLFGISKQINSFVNFPIFPLLSSLSSFIPNAKSCSPHPINPSMSGIWGLSNPKLLSKGIKMKSDNFTFIKIRFFLQEKAQ